MGGVFISYRRADSQGSTGRLADQLKPHLRADTPVFLDVDSIRPGEDFTDVITETLDQCDVALVMIGPRWVDLEGDNGQRRLDDPGDLVRIEVESALASSTTKTIPVLVDGAKMPAPETLPASMAEITSLHAAELTPSRFAADTAALGRMVRGAVTAPSDLGALARGASVGFLLLAAAVVLAIAGTGSPAIDDPIGAGTVRVGGAETVDVDESVPVVVATDDDVIVTVDGIGSAAEVQLGFTLAGIPMGASDWTPLIDGAAALEPSVPQWTASGAVVGDVTVRDDDGEVLAARSFPADVDRPWFVTATGIAMAVAFLSGFAYLESGLRTLRKGRARRIGGAYVSVAFGGALLALAFVLVSAVLRTIHLSVGTTIVALLLGAAGSTALGYTLYTAARRRLPAGAR